MPWGRRKVSVIRAQQMSGAFAGREGGQEPVYGKVLQVTARDLDSVLSMVGSH